MKKELEEIFMEELDEQENKRRMETKEFHVSLLGSIVPEKETVATEGKEGDQELDTTGIEKTN